LINQRSALFSKINSPPSETSLPKHFLWKQYNALTDDIIEGLQAQGGPLADEWVAASAAFRKEADILKNPKVQEFVDDIFTEGGLSGEKVFARMTGAEADTNLEHLARITGDAYPIFREKISSTVQGQLLEDATTSLGEVDVNKLWKATKGVSRKLIPQSVVDALQALARRSEIVTRVATRRTDTVELSPEIHELLKGNKAAVQSLTTAQSAERIAQETYRNAIFSELRNGSSATISKNPDKFLSVIFKGNYSVENVSEMMGLLGRNSPKLVPALQEKYIADALQRLSSGKGLKLAELEQEFGSDL
jgi:hypothetical protein